MRRLSLVIFSILFLSIFGLGAIIVRPAVTEAATASDSVGVEGTVAGTPPSQGATITFPKNGQVFTNNPVTVTGICPSNLLIKLFINNVFVGSDQCRSGNFSIITNLFSGRNDLIARVYDSLDQQGPDSNTVSVTLNSALAVNSNSFTLTSNFAKRGANPHETLTWPVIISGGVIPYAISVSWGDSQAPDLISQTTSGVFDIKHVYDSSGVYKIIIKAVDRDGNTAFLQLVGVGNGPLSQANNQKGPTVITKTVVLWWPAAILMVFILVAFWLGTRYELNRLLHRHESDTDLLE